MIVYICQCYSLSCPTLSFLSCVHKSILYICVSIPVLQISLSVPFFKIPYICVNIWSFFFFFPGLLYSVWQAFVIVLHSLSRVWLFATPWTEACHASLSFTMSQSLLKLMSFESVMPINHLIPLSFSSPSSFYFSQNQDIFQWVGSLHQVA